jgi:hypothetical protein
MYFTQGTSNLLAQMDQSGGATNSKFKSKLMSVILKIIDKQYQKQTCETDHFIEKLLITWYISIGH